jgi:hypothetical protein
MVRIIFVGVSREADENRCRGEHFVIVRGCAALAGNSEIDAPIGQSVGVIDEKPLTAPYNTFESQRLSKGCLQRPLYALKFPVLVKVFYSNISLAC